MRQELLKGLTEEQIAKVKACKNQEELLAIAKEVVVTAWCLHSIVINHALLVAAIIVKQYITGMIK